MAEEGEEKDREKHSKIEGLGLRQLLRSSFKAKPFRDLKSFSMRFFSPLTKTMSGR